MLSPHGKLTTTERADKLRPDADRPLGPVSSFPTFPSDPLLPPGVIPGVPPLLPPGGGAIPPRAAELPPPVQEKK